ncbi:MAG: beta-N-acetylhexosaminidase [Zoogloeaceae bacterium]|nr:beta-N-acetylhexosaminidase [Zoogloeaceae bacterium]
MLDVAGTELTADERDRLRHPLVGGVILFSRNFVDGPQLAALTDEIKAIRTPALLVSVDHEGGRVQRFRSGFTRLPAMGCLGALWTDSSREARAVARDTGFVLAAELLAHGVDLSYTPVLDLDYGCSRVIGDRGFHRDPTVVAALAEALVGGLAEAGMGGVGKHFPGHGFAEADSHLEIPVDDRSFDQIWATDLVPYRQGLLPRLAGVMPAHVIYSRVDPTPAGFSRYWLQEILRQRLEFDGVVFSDDLTMEGATVAGDIVSRATAAQLAGCDMVLVCNRPDLAGDLLDRWRPEVSGASRERVAALRRRTPAHSAPARAVLTTDRYREARKVVQALVQSA